ncbi:hypothetical protein [Marinobacterium lutimaris]|uniref:Iron transporter n=1 Tax=Marinobacterium lutimaris TaxID=568106 RepID=A0A1H6DIX1_9GAMM|nr:hypothetical protein [Marinobacterium lutimaris]SEG84803.1 hypothetical protein SAMN05444390_106186 [Marinobacterium lutimaris]
MPTSSIPQRSSTARTTASSGIRYRLAVTARVLLALVGGYILTSAILILLALVWPLPKAQALAASTMLSFLVYVAVVIWIFSVKRLRNVCAGLLISTLLCVGLIWLLGGIA